MFWSPWAYFISIAHCSYCWLLAAGWSLSVPPLRPRQLTRGLCLCLQFPRLYTRSCDWQAVPWWSPWTGSTVPCLKTTLSLPGPQPLAWLLPHSVLSGSGPGWPGPVPCLQTPPSWTAHEEPMLRFGCSPVSAGHLRLDSVLLWPPWL